MNRPTGNALRREIIETNALFGTDYDPDGDDPAQGWTLDAAEEGMRMADECSTLWAVDAECTGCGMPLGEHTLAVDLDGRAVAIHRETSAVLPCHTATPTAIWRFEWCPWITVEEGPEKGMRIQLCFGGVEPDTGGLLGSVDHVSGSRVYRAYGQMYDHATGVIYEGGLVACRTAVERHAKWEG